MAVSVFTSNSRCDGGPTGAPSSPCRVIVTSSAVFEPLVNTVAKPPCGRIRISARFCVPLVVLSSRPVPCVTPSTPLTR